MNDIKRIVSWDLKIEVEWEDGITETLNFPEHLARYVDEFLTDIEESRVVRYEEDGWTSDRFEPAKEENHAIT